MDKNPHSKVMPTHVDNSASEKQLPVAFVVCPIGVRGSEIRFHSDIVLKYIVRPAIQDRFRVKRGDEDERPGLITHHTFLDIEDAEMIVADLSFLNANAFYELGVAHAIGKRIVHICSTDTVLPFDIHDYRAVFFDPRDPESHERAAAEISRFADAVMKESYPLNPYTAAIGRSEAVQRQLAADKSIESLYRDVDFLKAAVRNLPRPGSRASLSEDAVMEAAANLQKMGASKLNWTPDRPNQIEVTGNELDVILPDELHVFRIIHRPARSI